LDCVPCIRIHRGGCPASHVNEDGTPICIHCLDRISCPVQRRVMASGTTVQDRAAYIVSEARKRLSEIKRRHNEYMIAEVKSSFEAQTVHPSEVTIARESQEDPQMSTSASEITPRPSTVRPTRTCSSAGCEATLSYNNSKGTCQKHSSRKTNGHNGAQPHLKRQAAPAKRNGNGAAHDHSNGNGNGHAARTADGSLILMPRVESRVDLLLALIPAGEKAKLLAVWIAGTV